MTARRSCPLLVDAHVHFHPCFERESFLDAARANFDRAARRLGVSGRYAGVLLLADPAGTDSLRALSGGHAGSASWTIEALGEDIALRARRADGAELTLLRGRQLRSVERLEVLALVWGGDLPEGAPLGDTVRRASEAGALTVLPWGFGKWRGRRGSRVADVVAGAVPGRLFVGDSGARLAGTPAPALLRRAGECGIFNLPGSDPFPLRSHQRRPGSRGFVIEGELSSDRPGETLRRHLSRLSAQPRTFGSGMGPLDFVAGQARLQLAKLRGRGAA